MVDAAVEHPADVATSNAVATITQEVAAAWRRRVGSPEEPAPADRVQNLFNDIELYPTKTQVFEMLVCARQCARRKSLTLTFGEFCVFSAELRRCSRQAKQTSNKTESPHADSGKEVLGTHMNGSEATPPPCEVFLGGSCNPTTWRSEIAIPMLKKMGITYFNPQVKDWSKELIEVEYRAKAAARALLFVLDSETRAVAASVEAADLAAKPRDLLLVLRPYTRSQTIAGETISDQEYVELCRARATLQEAVERRGLPAFSDIPAALRCARAVLRGARTLPRQPLGHAILRLKRAFDAAGARAPRLPRAQALLALHAVTQAPPARLDRCLSPDVRDIDFETFCAAVAEIAADGESSVSHWDVGGSVGARAGGAAAGAGGVASGLRRALRSLRDKLHALVPAPAPERSERSAEGAAGVAAEAGAADAAGAALPGAEPAPALRPHNARLREYGKKLRLDIPKNNGSRMDAGDSCGVLTPGTERRLQRLPSMLASATPTSTPTLTPGSDPPAYQYDVYLGGSFPAGGERAERLAAAAGLTCVLPRVNDYSRMLAAPPAPAPPARRAAPPHPDSPRTDKKPRADRAHLQVQDDVQVEDDVQLRDRSASSEPSDRLSASDFYNVSEDVTPQPFKGTYDEELLVRSRWLVFAASAEAPSFATLVLAAHYMALRPRDTVLLVQPLCPARLAPHYSAAAVKDYNRGRDYLTDLARRAGVPVFDSTEGVVACLARRMPPRPAPAQPAP